ncbi:hypothetical protein L810_2817 [Burkholderia sp. AU4i]|nr:hypothetical protein L810_2817 [Burkholderia sp. AU4i]MDW9230122.1 diguanylate cyclase domain protein [Burkholderia cepacia]MDW9247652.1 hypothetical protein [Burkholderia cepacia]QOH37586.1 hypothetical protein C7S14_3139 [Burkholderia cepacia]
MTALKQLQHAEAHQRARYQGPRQHNVVRRCRPRMHPCPLRLARR